MGLYLKHARLIFATIFLVAGIFASLLIPMSLNERILTNIQTVSGTIEKLEFSARNSATVNVFLEGDDKPYWIIPASFKQITGEGVFSKELISSYLPIGLDIEMQVVPFRSGLSVMGIVAGDKVIMNIDESAAIAYSDAMVTLWLGIILISILFPLGLLFLILGILRIVKEKKMDNSEKNEYGIRKILYEYLGNTITVFHKVEIFTISIFLNGALHSQHNSFVISEQKMDIAIKVPDKEIGETKEEVLTLTVNGFGTLKLFNRQELLIKKRQPFG